MTTTPTTQQLLDDRYGRTPDAERRTRRLMIIAGIVFAAVFTAWVVWGGLSGTNAELEVRELGYTNVTDTSIEVRWEVSVEPGTTVSCAVQALNESFGIVGWRIVELPASPERTRVLVETLRTAEPPVTGLPYRCWLT
ncbi:DUF4307 domain-containing protein [Microcella frigidaquae]|uniref:DUF4307 domain-containing protein n=1 Tax=Microcella frigidaquae TaxID=424758 RepID=A0A840X4Z2_9MICO|nr:DUF4307 domain-containing protein [Microcella frigidaquae]MBB5617450.1 hypothetical protein [Microcella frigidaquae]NHN45319.1 DUF4307 domain-containing protein [Microcella frigidaquae]